jgi:hypothetical protein
LPKRKNQIQPGRNDIVVAGDVGSKLIKTMDKPSWRYSWNIDSAYVIHDDEEVHDIGMAITTDPENVFFDRNKLILMPNVENAKIVPLCLGAESLDIRNKEVLGLGWGIQYNEYPDIGSTRNPILSSCMTSEASLDKWKFQNCDMQRMKKNKRGKCNKKDPPPSYQQNQDQECRDNFIKAKKLQDIDDLSKTIAGKVRKIDKMYIYDANGKKTTCYNPTKLKQSGWCYLKDFKEKYDANYKGEDAWGICSPSCRLKKVLVMV